MAAATRNILVFGATGLIGEHISSAIVANKQHFDRIALFTSTNTLWTKSDHIDSLKAQGVEIIVGDLKLAGDVNEAYNGIDTVVSCVGRQVIGTQVHLVQLADKHPDVKRFLPSEYGTDIEYGPESKDEKPHQQKLQVRAALKQTLNLDYTYIVTGPYGDADPGLYLSAWPADKEAGGTFDVKRKRAVVLGDGEGKVSLTTMRDVGKLVVAALLHPEAGKKKALRLNSFTATPKQIVAEFEKQTGGEQWRVDSTPINQLRKMEMQARDTQDPRATAYTLRRIWTEGGTLYEKRDNELIGMEDKTDTLEDAVAQAIKVQSGWH